MGTESRMHRMASDSGIKRGVTTISENMRSSASAVINGPPAQESLTHELSILLRNHSRADAMVKLKDMAVNRSGSAPPVVDGSFATLGNLFSSNVESGSNVANSGPVGVEGEEELRSDPAYLAYYYSHINTNPRLPPPIISQKNYLLAHRLANGAKSTSFDNDENRSLFMSQLLLPNHKEELQSSENGKPLRSDLSRQDNWKEWGPDGASGLLHDLRPKSLVDRIQQDFPRTPSPVYNQIRSSSRLANEEVVDGVSVSDPVMPSTAATELSSAPSGMPSTLSSYIPSHNPSGGQAIGTISSGSSLKLPGLITSISSSEPLSMVVDIPENLAEFKGPPNSRMTHLHGSSLLDDKDAGGTSNLATVFQGLNFSSTDSEESLGLSLNPQHLLEMSYQEPHSKMSRRIHLHSQHSRSAQGQSQSAHHEAFPHAFQSEQQILGLEPSSTMQSKLGLSSHSPSNNGASKNVYTAAAMSHLSDNQYFPNLQTPNMYGSPYRMTGYSMNSTDNISKCSSSAAFEKTPAGLAGWSLASGTDMYQLYKNMSQGGTLSESWLSDPVYQHYLQQKHAVNGGHNSLSTLSQSRLSDHVYLQYLQQQAVDDGHGSISTVDSGMLREYLAAAQIDRFESQKSKKTPIVGYPSEFRSCAARDSNGMQIANKIGLVSPKCYDSSPLFANSALSSPDSLRLSNRGAAAGIYGGWQGQRSADISGDLKCSSLLEELKNCKTRRFELDDIAGHVVEFSVDQHGSRFIQQKLEVSSSEGKNMVFEEVLPRALTLMTDVFGNYVIQKFFEYGSSDQRSELANQLMGHVLELSLQMYGCRVIQKALEVVSVDQQVSIVSELNGHVMRCVRDQNGNHVIQKCIECVPTEHIQFIISACYGQVVMLSTHPYGCRVVQRVLEHCTDKEKQNSIIEDILSSTCDLAQDQYGNYVVQHVLEHGKPYEKAEIMKKLAGQIVQMSQHKFASNVVEKCLEFGGSIERQILISEMLGHTDENEPLQAMMKDQYANYVVQKVLETCDDQQRELLLSRIKVHLHALKKYTYGKHIVARVEKLVAAGERRSAQVSM